MNSLINAVLDIQAKEQKAELVNRRAAEPVLSKGRAARFMGRIEFDGHVHYYDTRTQICERRRGSGNIPTGKRAGWIVSNKFNGNGRNGMYARYDAYVIRPKTIAELTAEAKSRDARKTKLLSKRALPFKVRLLLAHSGYAGRKQVLRTDAAFAEKLAGLKYEPTAFVISAKNDGMTCARMMRDEDTVEHVSEVDGYRFNGWSNCSRSRSKHFSRSEAEAIVQKLNGKQLPRAKFVCDQLGRIERVEMVPLPTRFFIEPAFDLSPYGPRTRNLLTRVGVPVEKHNEILRICGFEI